MWKHILTAIALGFTIGPAPAQNQIEKIAALNTLSGEYLECAAYFSAVAYCMTGYPAPLVPKISRDYQQAAKIALSRANSTGRVAGGTDSLAEAQSKPVGATKGQSIKSNCLNFSDLAEHYDAFCKQLMQAPDKRVEELLAGRYCTGQYRCFLGANSAARPLRTGY
jgi:hypothetical protein